MQHRTVFFDEKPIRVTNDNGVEYVCLMDVVGCLGLKWANENQRARDKFDVKIQVIPVLNSKKMSVTTVIDFGNLETYLHSFKDRHGGFKPPEGFYTTLKRMIAELPDIIYDSQPDMIASSPNTVNGVDTVEENINEFLGKADPDAKPVDEDAHFEEIQKISDQMKAEVDQEMAEAESMDPHRILEEEEEKDLGPEAQSEQESEQESEKQDAAPEVDSRPEPEEVKATSYTAFPLSDGFKQNIDNMIDSTDLFIDALTEFKSSLEELRNSQFVMLKNSE